MRLEPGRMGNSIHKLKYIIHDSPNNKLLIFETSLSKFSTDYKYAKQVDVHYEHAGKTS